jgi:hypothetical protein
MPTSQAIDALKAERDAHKTQADQHFAQARALDQAIALLTGEALLIAPDDADLPKSFEGLGIADAAKKLIKEFGEPLDTGTITRELLKRGWKTDSKKPVATVYATLDNSSDIVRVGGQGRKGKWTVKESTKG